MQDLIPSLVFLKNSKSKDLTPKFLQKRKPVLINPENGLPTITSRSHMI